jgi:putative endonuclease
MKQFNRKVGKEGEEIATKFLLDKGYKILERNYSTRFGEIDLIASKYKQSLASPAGNVLIFVEVKLKHGDNFGTPEEMIGSSKLFQVQRMAEFYLMDKPQMAKIYKSYSIGAVCIVTDKDGKVERINHYENLTF